jgi:hypothetical protein
VQSDAIGLNAMSNDPTLFKIEVDDLEQRIQAARSHYGAVCEADKDWQEMVRAHTEMQRKLDAAENHSAEALESIRFDVDILRNSVERWMAQVERKFTQDTKR